MKAMNATHGCQAEHSKASDLKAKDRPFASLQGDNLFNVNSSSPQAREYSPLWGRVPGWLRQPFDTSTSSVQASSGHWLVK